MNRTPLALSVGLLLAACGGGSSTPAAVDDAQRAAAASATANNHPDCLATTLGPYYWELGDGDGVLASGSVGDGAPGPNTRMRLYSASKWIYAAHVAQMNGLRDEDVPYLNFTSGHTLFGLPACPGAADVQSCGHASSIDPATVGRFVYDSGHMQHHAQVTMGLGAADNAALTAAITASLGESGFAFEQPHLAAGIEGSAQGYAHFLRRILRGELVMAGGLGAHAVPADGNDAGGPTWGNEHWRYALGHWVESDPATGDGSFSSTGAAGFYPWIDADRRLYGILAREQLAQQNAPYRSVTCGRLIRRAWRSGAEVQEATPG